MSQHKFSKLLVVLFSLFFVFVKLEAIARDRIALIIGNSNYIHDENWPDLPNASNDAKDIAHALEQHGFKVTHEENLSITKMEETVLNFVDNLRPNDVGLLYYAGHGVEIGGENYLIPVELGASRKEGTIKRGSLSIQTYINKMEEKRSAGLHIIILDACRNNPFQVTRGRGGGLSPIYVRGIRIIAKNISNIASGVFIGFATSPNTTASENSEERNGLFTKYLLEAINTPGLTLEKVFKHARTKVVQESEGEQVPWSNSSLLGEDFCFTSCKKDNDSIVSPTKPTNDDFPSDEEFPPEPILSKKRKWLEPQVIFQDYLQDESLGPEMVVVPAGRFKMGDIQNSGDSDEQPIHYVNLKQFAIGRYEITVEEFQKFIQTTGYQTYSEVSGKGCYTNRAGYGWKWRERANWQTVKQSEKHPVVCVNWYDAIAYTDWLTEQTGQPYSLPSEAQWEYMARSDTQSKYWWGNQIGYDQANCWETSRWSQTTTPVGTFQPNFFKVYDTIGNVWEWVADHWHSNYGRAPLDGKAWLDEDSAYRILRGGAWVSQPVSCRVSERFKVVPIKSSARIGFRVAIQEVK